MKQTHPRNECEERPQLRSSVLIIESFSYVCGSNQKIPETCSCWKLYHIKSHVLSILIICLNIFRPLPFPSLTAAQLLMQGGRMERSLYFHQKKTLRKVPQTQNGDQSLRSPVTRPQKRSQEQGNRQRPRPRRKRYQTVAETLTRSTTNIPACKKCQ